MPKYRVCSVCSGEGEIVNPEVDGHGLTREDFDEDPDFAESYFSGTYDIGCPCCKGVRVVTLAQEREYAQNQQDLYVMRMESGLIW